MENMVDLRTRLDEMEADYHVDFEAQDFVRLYIDSEYYLPEGSEYVIDFVTEHVEADIYYSDLTEWMCEDCGYHIEEYLNEVGWPGGDCFWGVVQAAQKNAKEEQVMENLDDIKDEIAIAYMIHAKGLKTVDEAWLEEVLGDLPEARNIDRFWDIYDVVDNAIEEMKKDA